MIEIKNLYKSINEIILFSVRHLKKKDDFIRDLKEILDNTVILKSQQEGIDLGTSPKESTIVVNQDYEFSNSNTIKDVIMTLNLLLNKV